MVRISPTPITLSGNGQSSSWYDLTDVDESFVVTGALTGTLTVGLEIANDVDGKTDAVIVESYTASFAKKVNKPFPRTFRFRTTSGTGSVIIGFGQSGKKDITVNESTNTPQGSFS
jgi:hypothetical protein